MSDTQNIELLYPRPSRCCLIEGLGGGGGGSSYQSQNVRKVRRVAYICGGRGGGRAYDRGYSFLLQVDWPPRGYLGH